MNQNDSSYSAAWWLRNPHAQTVWGRVARRIPRVATELECLTTPDGDNIELHHLSGAGERPRVLVLHGLEGSRQSHYIGGILARAKERGWNATVLMFRGCGLYPNVARRFYHSGETQDLDFVFAELSSRWPRQTWVAVGVSLGGNVLLKWLGELGGARSASIRAAAVVSVPFDLEAGARHISRGFARIYDRSFVRSLRRKAVAKLSRYPNLFDQQRLAEARTIYDFDDAVTAPVHGFQSAHDYYQKSSALEYLPRVCVPTLLLSAYDDPFLPPEVLDRVRSIAATNADLYVEFHDRGGHVGFVGGVAPWRPIYYAEYRIMRFLESALERLQSRRYD